MVIYDAKKGIDRRDEMNNQDEYMWSYEFNTMTFRNVLVKIIKL